MQYRKLGRWGVRVSEISLGSWITYGGSVGDDAARDCIRRAYELGVNFFDTANVYHRGAAERIMGAALAEFRRDSLVVGTKVFHPMGEGANDAGLSRKHVIEQLHASLSRLDTDYVDLYQCHRYDDNTPLEETVRAMSDLISQGKVLYWGTSEWRADQIAAAVEIARAGGWYPPVSNQPQYNALYRRVEKSVLSTTAACGMGNVIWSPLAMGVLTGKYARGEGVPEGTRADSADRQFMDAFDYLSDSTLDTVALLGSLADEAGVSLGQLALRWVLRRPEVSSVIVGATKVAHVDENIAATEADVDPAVIERMTAILEGAP